MTEFVIEQAVPLNRFLIQLLIVNIVADISNVERIVLNELQEHHVQQKLVAITNATS